MASFSTSAWLISAGTVSLPRILPLICTTTSFSVSTMAASSATGQAATSMSPSLPSIFHSSKPMCGVMG
ncbi:hypothetical protein D3C74_501320 [compost metagenome]